MDEVVLAMEICMRAINDIGGASCYIGSYAFNSVFSGYRSFNKLPISNIDALCVMPKTNDKFKTFEEKMNWYVKESKKLAGQVVDFLNKTKKVKAKILLSSDMNNILLFPGTSIKISNRGIDGFVSIEANCDFDCVEMNKNITTFFPNWELLLLIQNKAKDADEKHKKRYELMFDLLEDEARKNKNLNVIESLLSTSEKIFRGCSIQEYRFTGTNIFSDMISYFNPPVTVYENKIRMAQGDMKTYMDYVIDKI